MGESDGWDGVEFPECLKTKPAHSNSDDEDEDNSFATAFKQQFGMPRKRGADCCDDIDQVTAAMSSVKYSKKDNCMLSWSVSIFTTKNSPWKNCNRSSQHYQKHTHTNNAGTHCNTNQTWSVSLRGSTKSTG